MGNTATIDGVDITWLGHASFLFRYGGKSLYIDPYKVTHGEKADIILITHDHYDHCDPSSISVLRKERTSIIGTENCRLKVKDLIVLKAGNLETVDDVEVRAVPAYNLHKHFHPEGQGLGFVFMFGGLMIYHAGDTDRIPEMDCLGEIDVALLPIGGTYTMDHEEATEAAARIKARLTIPMHYGCIVGSRDDAEQFKKRCEGEVEILSNED